jgi:FixJ family two-component response regulator
LSLQRRSGADQALVIIVDDHASVREALSELIQSAGFEAVCFASAREFLDADLSDTPGCMILDVRMPGASGLDLQRHLAQNGNSKPIIFLTGHGDIPMSVQAMKAGAVDFLTKPVRDQTLLGSAAGRDARERAPIRQVRVADSSRPYCWPDWCGWTRLRVFGLTHGLRSGSRLPHGSPTARRLRVDQVP